MGNKDKMPIRIRDLGVLLAIIILCILGGRLIVTALKENSSNNTTPPESVEYTLSFGTYGKSASLRSYWERGSNYTCDSFGTGYIFLGFTPGPELQIETLPATIHLNWGDGTPATRLELEQGQIYFLDADRNVEEISDIISCEKLEVLITKVPATEGFSSVDELSELIKRYE